MLWIKWICEFVIGFATFFQGVSTMELNAHKDEWLLGIKNLQEQKRTKKRRIKGSYIICEHQYLQIGCKLKKARFFKP
jgi:hypothetical protein